MSGTNDETVELDAMIDDESNSIDSSGTMRSILKLIDLLPVQEPSSELVNSTIRLVLCDLETEI